MILRGYLQAPSKIATGAPAMPKKKGKGGRGY
jgi:hypothetical protein